MRNSGTMSQHYSVTIRPHVLCTIGVYTFCFRFHIDSLTGIMLSHTLAVSITTQIQVIDNYFQY